MYFALIFYGGFFGAIGLSMISSGFRPYPDDMSLYLLYSVPVGTLLGWLTGGIIALLINEKFVVAGITGLVSGLILGAMHLDFSDHTRSVASSRVAISYENVGLIWCFLIVLLGLISLYKARKKRPVG